MQVERIHELDLTSEDEAQIADLMARCFETDFGGRSFFQQRHHLRLALRDEGKIVAHMALDFRVIRLGEDLCDAVGLAEVATDPTYRGKGLATVLMNAAVEEAKASLADFFVLFGDRPIYAGHGFRTVPNHAIYTTMEGARSGKVVQRPTGALMVLPLRGKPWNDSVVVDLMGHKF
ncbi:Predicted N-acetyltransferase YhbS [Cognatiyoonia sediminum]|uniref:Predicted N-acetyltransferase YhbS n=1 Tax=Cognatiyoonia sediminum TaxID=1508389 RepID=A0A1M5Q4G6_9RHOB|nr:GNAT family N-acetyltransferase [Cognatiyoonia sediminum]SHH08892.1 Predicted N-acetyltransferase YhbS [Cognatiyoonia sediminum]